MIFILDFCIAPGYNGFDVVELMHEVIKKELSGPLVLFLYVRMEENVIDFSICNKTQFKCTHVERA